MVASISRSKVYSPPKDESLQQSQMLELVAYTRHLERAYSALKNAIPESQRESDALLEVEPYFSTIQTDSGEVDDTEEVEVKVDHLKNQTSPNRFFGPLSNIVLVKSAFQELSISDQGPPDTPNTCITSGLSWRRPKFWMIPSWAGQAGEVDSREFEFPPDDLISSLIDLFFIYVSPYAPILHQPTFTQSVRDGLHHRDHHFADLLLTTCAIASRFSSDPRVLINGQQHSAGWMWFCQVRLAPDFAYPVTLYQLQTAIVAICYLHDGPPPMASNVWPILGVAIRLSQDVGLHRLRGPPSATTESWKRAYWMLLCIDIILSACHGRPRATNPNDHDLSPVAVVDDQYWDTFKQPAGKPSMMDYFVEFLKLLDILAFSQRTIFAAKKPIKGDPKVWTGNILSQLRKALEDWSAELPDHLRWNPDQQDPVFFNQAAYLQATLSWVKILIYRPFIPLRPQNLSFSFSALAESANAARLCARALYALFQRDVPLALPQFQMALLSSGVVLILQLRLGHKRGLKSDTAMDMRYIQEIMQVLQHKEERFLSTGRFYDILNELLHSIDNPLTSDASPSPANNKRRADSDEPYSVGSSSSSVTSDPDSVASPIADPLAPAVKYNDPYDPYAVAVPIFSDLELDLGRMLGSEGWQNPRPDAPQELQGYGGQAVTSDWNLNAFGSGVSEWDQLLAGTWGTVHPDLSSSSGKESKQPDFGHGLADFAPQSDSFTQTFSQYTF